MLGVSTNILNTPVIIKGLCVTIIYVRGVQKYYHNGIIHVKGVWKYLRMNDYKGTMPNDYLWLRCPKIFDNETPGSVLT